MSHKKHQRTPVRHRKSTSMRELKALAAEFDEREEREEQRHRQLVQYSSMNGEHVGYVDAVNYA